MAYFDHNATTPLCAPAREAWLRVQDRLWHNASSLYREAAAARDELERCRERLAELTGTDDPEALIFTSGATEGGNAYFRLAAELTGGTPGSRVRVVMSPFEHPAVREPARQWCGAKVVDEVQLEAVLRSGDGDSEKVILAWMAANNETGEVFDWQRWARFGAGGRLRTHFCDASQWMGKRPAGAFAGMEPDMIGCAHKFGGPKGVGFIRMRSGREALSHRPWQIGGPQEHGARAGTEDVAGVSAMIAALEWCENQMPGEAGPRDEFEQLLAWPVVANNRPRLWNTSMVVAPRHQNKLWLARLSQRGFQCSTGSACSSGKDGDSHVLAALGLQPDEMRRVLRFSSGWTTSPDDWRALHTALGEVLKELDEKPLGVTG